MAKIYHEARQPLIQHIQPRIANLKFLSKVRDLRYKYPSKKRIDILIGILTNRWNEDRRVITFLLEELPMQDNKSGSSTRYTR